MIKKDLFNCNVIFLFFLIFQVPVSGLDSSTASKSSSQVKHKGTFSLESNLLNETSKQIVKEKMRVSVFHEVDDTDESQQNCALVNSLVSFLFSSELRMKHCLSCKDAVYVKSQKHCKICKLKKSLKSGRQHSKPIKVPDPPMDFKKLKCVAESSSSRRLDKEKNFVVKYRRSIQKRRQLSLAHELKKICSLK